MNNIFIVLLVSYIQFGFLEGGAYFIVDAQSCGAYLRRRRLLEEIRKVIKFVDSTKTGIIGELVISRAYKLKSMH